MTTIEPTAAPALEGPLAAQREREVLLLNDIATAIAALGDAAVDDRRRLLDVAQDLRDLFFLVVVIGEFNAGKSTFINALLGDDLLAMGITPTTEAIHLIRNGDVTRKPTMREDGIYEWRHPNTGAPGVALVDTPGTGSIFQKHERTAKSFLHRSDLVIFLISAKRALAETERMYLQLARDYGKKIIIVINQADLLDARERGDVRRFVERQVEELLDLKPLIFLASARDALRQLKGETMNQPDHGLDVIKAHLRGVFEQIPPAKQKLLAQLDLAERVLRRQHDLVKTKGDLVSADVTLARDVESELERQALALTGPLAAARGQVDTVFEAMRLRGLSFINERLSIRRFGRRIDREQLQREFQDRVVGRALRDINDASTAYINALIDSSRQYWRTVIERLNQIKQLLDNELSGLDASIYAEQREALTEAIRMAEGELQSYSSGRVIGDLQSTFEANMNSFTLSFGAALVGLIVAVVAASAPGPVLGAGAIATASVAFLIALPVTAVGGYIAFRYIRRISQDAQRELNNRVDALEASYHAALNDVTQRERARLSQYGKQVMMPIFSRLNVMAEGYTGQIDRTRALLDQITALRRDIETS